MERPGMAAVDRWLGRNAVQSQQEIVWRIAAELRGEINGLWAAMNGAASARPGKKEQARREAVMHGLRVALTLALGLPLGSHEELDSFLEDFKQERLTAARKN